MRENPRFSPIFLVFAQPRHAHIKSQQQILKPFTQNSMISLSVDRLRKHFFAQVKKMFVNENLPVNL